MNSWTSELSETLPGGASERTRSPSPKDATEGPKDFLSVEEDSAGPVPSTLATTVAFLSGFRGAGPIQSAESEETTVSQVCIVYKVCVEPWQQTFEGILNSLHDAE